jgi:hypothetical protein
MGILLGGSGDPYLILMELTLAQKGDITLTICVRKVCVSSSVTMHSADLDLLCLIYL